MKCQCWNIGFFPLHQFQFLKIERHYNDRSLWSNLLIGYVSGEVPSFWFLMFSYIRFGENPGKHQNWRHYKNWKFKLYVWAQKYFGDPSLFPFLSFCRYPIIYRYLVILNIIHRYDQVSNKPNADHCLWVWLPLAIPLSNACVLALFYLPNGS